MLMRGWAVLALCVAGFANAAEPVDLAVTSKIRNEAFRNSQVMKTMTEISEEVGPRLSNSPGMARANQWAQDKLKSWGISNVRSESIGSFGRGWEFTQSSVHMLSPRAMPLHALPRAWSPGTNGAVEGEAIAAKLETAADLEKWKGKLRGKVVFISDLRPYKASDKPDLTRHTDATLHEVEAYDVPGDIDHAGRDEDVKKFLQRRKFSNQLNSFLVAEGAIGSVNISSWNDGIVRVMSAGSRKAGESEGVPAFTMAAEHYNQVMRALQRKATVKLRLQHDGRFTDATDQPAYNVIGEIPGTGPQRDEIVMIGAHLDSWHAGTGATDNGAGTAVMMEAMRILKAIGARPNRTIRIGLWTGEEQGLIGSRGYVAEHFGKWSDAANPDEKDLPRSMRSDTPKLIRGRDHGKFAAYFNLDNGGGRIRGVYAQENMAVVPIFQDWLKPWNDVGAGTITMRNTGSTDHVSFDDVGLPGFQFVQDGMDYFTHTHHTDLDVLDHINAEDLKVSAAIVASFAYNAAMRKDKLPRKDVE